MAVRMIEDGHDDLYDVAIVITNDGDLEDALRYVTQRLRFKGWLYLIPFPNTQARLL